MNEREFWIQIRRGLIVMLDAIDVRFALNTVRPSVPAPLKEASPESLASPERISINGVRNR